MKKIELAYKVFNFESCQQATVENLGAYIQSNETNISQFFSNVFRINETLQFGKKYLNAFNVYLLNNSQVVIQLKPDLQLDNKILSALLMFEYVVNMYNVITPEDYEKDFVLCENNGYIFLKNKKFTYSNALQAALLDVYETHKNNSNFAEQMNNLNQIYTAVTQDILIAQVSMDILNNTHFTIIFNPNVAISNTRKDAIKEILNTVDVFFNY